jgi:hypothetical protein
LDWIVIELANFVVNTGREYHHSTNWRMMSGDGALMHLLVLVLDKVLKPLPLAHIVHCRYVKPEK